MPPDDGVSAPDPSAVSTPDPPAVSAPDPPAVSAPPGPAVVEPDPNSPWAGDLATTFDDPALRGRVDSFLRETVQPYVTRLEQQAAPNRNAERLWDDFTNQPAETFMSVSEEMFGEEKAEAIRKLLAEEGADPADPDVTDADQLDALAALPAPVRQAVEFAQTETRQRAWDGALAQIRTDNPGLDVDEGLFAPFVNAAKGDLDTAVAGYKEFTSTAAAKFGVAPAPPPDPADAPPPVIDGSTRAPSAPQIKENAASIGDAVDELFEDMQTPPTIVGVP